MAKNPDKTSEFTKSPIYALIGGGDRGGKIEEAIGDSAATSSHRPYYTLYKVDNYGCFSKLFKPDGFNSFIFVMNDGGGRYFGWPTGLPGFVVSPRESIEMDIQTAQESGFFPIAEFLVAGMANANMAEVHPEWRAMRADDTPAEYMGPLMCANSPYWREYLLPMYWEFSMNYGRYFKGIVLWEGPSFWCWSDYCKKAFEASGETDYDQWKWHDRLRKWKEISDTIRSTGWKGLIIGGGWAAYEWEEEVWDSTVGGRTYGEYKLPELQAFQKGYVDIIMPELLTHSEYGAHFYRRRDHHYVYRSLMYERSLFGSRIIPNVELTWAPRFMSPHELLRWLLEVNAAGYRSYSVVSDGKLYLEAPEYRPQWRGIFRAVNDLPYMGEPMVRFHFVVSEYIEKRLIETPWPNSIYRHLLGANWCSYDDIDGEQTWRNTYEGPSRPRKPTVVIPHLSAEKDYELHLSFLNDINHSFQLNLMRGSNKQPLIEIPLTNTGGFSDFSVRLGKERLRKLSRSSTINVTLSLTDAGNLNGPTERVVISRIKVTSAETGGIVYRMPDRDHFTNAYEWYRRKMSRLFKEVDRAVGGGAIVNEKRTDLPLNELYGGSSSTPIDIVIVPRGMRDLTPQSSGKRKIMYVDTYSDLRMLKDEVIAFIEDNSAPLFISKSNPLIYAMFTSVTGKRDCLTLINHSSENGTIEIPLEWSDIECLIDSGLLIDAKVDYRYANGVLTAKLDPFASIVLADREIFSANKGRAK